MGFLKGTIDATSIDLFKRKVLGQPGEIYMHKPRFLKSKVHRIYYGLSQRHNRRHEHRFFKTQSLSAARSNIHAQAAILKTQSP
jgi:hypothetical protein